MSISRLRSLSAQTAVLPNAATSSMSSSTSSGRTLTKEEIRRRMLVAHHALTSGIPQPPSDGHGNLDLLVSRTARLVRHASQSADEERAERWLVKALSVLVSWRLLRSYSSMPATTSGRTSGSLSTILVKGTSGRPLSRRCSARCCHYTCRNPGLRLGARLCTRLSSVGLCAPAHSMTGWTIARGRLLMPFVNQQWVASR